MKEIYDPSKPFNEQIRSLIGSTQSSTGPILVTPFGKRFKVERDESYWKGCYELTGSDTVGTKAALHWKMNTLDYAVQDAFAMVVDDLIEGGFVPFILQNQILLSEEDQERILAIVSKLVELCMENKWNYAKGKSNPIIISGGETAILNTVEGFEMGITATGYVRKGEEIRPSAKDGDIIIGLASNGVHSNGMSFLRDELLSKRRMRLDDELPWGIELGEELTKPTNIYLRSIKELIESFKERKGIAPGKAIHGMVHITGGGLSKLKELIPQKNLDIDLWRAHALEPQEIFRYIYGEIGIPSEKMYSRFNNGIGYVVAVDPQFSKHALSVLERHFSAAEIGIVKKGKGSVTIESAYENVEVKYR